MTARRVLLVVIASLLLAWSPTARAQFPAVFGVSIMYYINPDGTGMMIANPSPYGVGQISWEACPSGGGCSPIAATPPGDRFLSVGNAAVGTVFVATARHESQIASVRSVPYLGSVRSITPPKIDGQLRVGALVKPVAGSWSGGWGREGPYLQLQLCRSAGGSRCQVIADGVYWNKCRGAGAVLPRGYRGWFVRVIDRRITRETPFPAFAVGYPAALNPAQPGPATAAAIAGPIGPGSGPPQSRCGGLTPKVSLPAHPAWRDGHLVLGRVTCALACRIVVTVRQGSRRAGFVHNFSAHHRLRRLRLAARLARRFERGIATVSVSTWGDRISSRRILLPQP